ncbi:hypothetical protein H9Q72_002826 [Fusarium xylarioides]|uniref:BTB domain-containing protein n=1 Tax=Fusarium xylarioides TaxID=221167 RepID=A0A9P7HZ14_9HYPO|nr:hypothetical protein H9Q72_002826 [Fusarium xylarioides]
MPPEHYSFLFPVVESGKFSDFTLTCKDREFKLHQIIVCPQSPVISAALHSGFEQEATSKVIAVKEFDVATVQSMVTFLYTGDYELVLETEKPVEAKDTDEKSADGEIHNDEDNMSQAPSEYIDNAEEQILSHLRVNAIADYYNVEKLGKLSTLKIEAILRSHLDFLIIPQIIQEMSISNRDADLRHVIASAVAKYIEELTWSEALRTLDLERELAIDILEACGQRIQELVYELGDANQQKDSYKSAQELQEGANLLIISKVQKLISVLGNNTRCRHCSKEFGCYIEEPGSNLAQFIRMSGERQDSWDAQGVLGRR